LGMCTPKREHQRQSAASHAIAMTDRKNRVCLESLMLAFWLSVLSAVACADPITVCPAILHIKPTVPDTTTIKAGASTLAIAGATWGGETGPPPPDFVWKVADSTVVSVVPLDSVHARIQGLRPGRSTVTPTYKTNREAPPPVTVTVVP